MRNVADYNDKIRKKAIINLLRIINRDQVLLEKDDFILIDGSLGVRCKNDKEKIGEKLRELEADRCIGFLRFDTREEIFYFSEWDIGRIDEKEFLIDYTPMHELLSALIENKYVLKEVENVCFKIEQRGVSSVSSLSPFLEFFVDSFKEDKFDFSSLELSLVVIKEMAKEKIEGAVEKSFYQIELQNNKFDPVLFKEYITLEQLNNERNNLPDKNKYLFGLLDFLVGSCLEIGANDDVVVNSALLKLVLVLAAQHSRDAVFNVVLTLILKYWEKDKLYKANVIWVKNQFFNSSINLNSLLKLCDSREGQLYKMLKQLSSSLVAHGKISADQLFLCVPDDEAAELYAKAVFGATTAFQPVNFMNISRLVMLRLRAPYDEITATCRLQSNNGFKMVSTKFNNKEGYGRLSMGTLGSLAQIVPDNSTDTAEVFSSDVSENNLKRKLEEMRLNENDKRRKAEAIQANPDSQSPFESLPDEIVLNIFRFFNLRESLEAGKVCKQFNRIAHDRRLAEAQYKHYKIVHRSDIPLSRKELKKATLKLQQAVEATMQELNSLPHWYGDINKEQAEVILDQFPNKSYLLRNAEDIEGAIVLTYKDVVESDEASSSDKASSSSLEPVLKMEGALLLPKEKKNISLPENVREPSSSNFKHGLIRMIEGYDDKFYFMFGCFHSMKGYSSLSEIIKYYERMALIPARIEDFSANNALKI